MANSIEQSIEESVVQLEIDSERMHRIVNGTATEWVVVEDGSSVPTIRKAMLDNLYFKTPPIPWTQGTFSTLYNQLYVFNEPNKGGSWWYAPAATPTNPVQMKASPHDDPNWRLIIDTASIAEVYAPLESPNFKGNPQVPTADAGDKSQTIANTNFVMSAIEAINGGGTGSTFQNITVKGKATIQTLDVGGSSKFIGQLDAQTSQMLINTLRVMNDTGKIDFSYIDPAYSGKLRTLLTPHTVETSKATVDTAIIKNSAEVGTGDSTDTSLRVHNKAVIDLLEVRGNPASATGVPIVKVDGSVEVKNLKVTGDYQGPSANIDNADVKPASVTAKSITTEDLNVTKKAVIQDLQVLGNTTGINFPDANIDGDDIKPRSVTATNDSEFKSKVTVKDLVVTGTTSGITADVDGKDITPKNVTASGNIATTKDLGVGGIATIATLKLPSNKITLGDDSTVDLKSLSQASNGVGKYLTVSVGIGAGERKYYQNPYPGYAVDVKVYINPLGSATDSYESGWGYAPDDKDGNKMKMFGVRAMRQRIASGADAGDWIMVQVAEGGAAHKPELVGGGNTNINEAIKNTGSFQIRVTRLFKDAAGTPATPK